MATTDPLPRANKRFAVSVVLLAISLLLIAVPLGQDRQRWFRFKLGSGPVGVYLDDGGNAIPVSGQTTVEPSILGGARYAVHMTFEFVDGKALDVSDAQAWGRVFGSRRELITSTIESFEESVLSNTRGNGVECGEELLRACLENPQSRAVVYDYGQLCNGLLTLVRAWLPLAAGAFAVWAYTRVAIIEKRRLAGQCQWCGYAAGVAAICPECGRWPGQRSQDTLRGGMDKVP